MKYTRKSPIFLQWRTDKTTVMQIVADPSKMNGIVALLTPATVYNAVVDVADVSVQDDASDIDDFKRAVRLVDTAEEPAEFVKTVPGHKGMRKLPYVKTKAECSKSFDDLIMYRRPEALKQLKYMQDEHVGLVRGPPGCGKSTAAWYFALQYAERFPEDIVCWVHAGAGKRIILHNNIIREDLPEIHELHLVDNKNASILFIDGMVEGDFNEYRGVIRAARSKVAKIMLVTSLQFSPNASFIHRQHEVIAWTLQEYQEACAHAPFFAQVRHNLGADPDKEYDESQRRELVERKFSVGGYSARWMFDMDEAAVMDAIVEAQRGIDDVRKLFDHISAGDQLMMIDPTHANCRRLVFTSDAVAFHIAWVVSSDVMRDLHLLRMRYGSAVTEMQMVRIDFRQGIGSANLSDRVQFVAEAKADESSRATKAPDLVFESNFESTFTSPWQEVVEYHRDVLTEESAGMHHPGTWFVPRVYNLGGFDCVQLLERGGVPTLRFVYVTVKVQQDHPIRRDCMHTFLLALNEFRAKVQPHPEPPITAMEVVVMLPHDLALRAAPPSTWNVTGAESSIVARNGDGGQTITMTLCVAGFKLNL